MVMSYLTPAIVLIAIVLGIILVVQPSKKAKIIGKLILAIPIAMALLVIWFIAVLLTTFVSAFGNWYAVLSGGVALSVFLAAMFAIFGVIRRKVFFIPLLAGLVACVMAIGGVACYESYIKSVATVGEMSDQLWQYEPNNGQNKLAVLSQPSTLTFAAADKLPIIDGATALYPVYSAFVQATYPSHMMENARLVYDTLRCSKTPAAYTSLINGEADVIFAAGPSDKQLQEAAAAGVELVLTPIGKEAFVFFVNSQNPVDSLTVEQIQGIYSGDITGWRELGGGSLGSIRAFQRPEGSGSQTALQRLMEGKTLSTAPIENVVAGMGGIINRVADYRNFKNAIGYSFRFYSTEMVSSNEIKLLAVDGIAPTKENILNDSYPIVSSLYAVTRTDATTETKRLVEWVLSPQGQELIDTTGYVALK